jgi:hypothetical protein
MCIMRCGSPSLKLAVTSVEHVIPESLGNQGLRGKPPIVLPKGVVCDECNHGKLAILDNALIDFSPISLMRTRYGVSSKRGALPSTKLGNARLRSLSPGVGRVSRLSCRGEKGKAARPEPDRSQTFLLVLQERSR